MADRPILFSAPMVRALLAGTKTQTRRTAGVPTIEQTPNGLWHIHNRHGGEVVMTPAAAETYLGSEAAAYLPIQPGDRLWVRESFFLADAYLEAKTFTGGSYKADATSPAELKYTGWRPSIHMPRWASRLTLHVTDVRVQRLQGISEADAVAEGVSRAFVEEAGRDLWFGVPHVGNESALQAYADLWDSLNNPHGYCADDEPNCWEANPWVAAYTFTVERANIDQARAAA